MDRTSALLVFAFISGIVLGAFIVDDITGAIIVRPSYSAAVEPAVAVQPGMVAKLNLSNLKVYRQGGLQRHYPPNYLIISADTL